jgi:hypothetical protein
MRLVGQFSNPSSRLQTVLEAFPDGSSAPGTTPTAPDFGMQKLGNGVVQRAIVKVLASADLPMRARDIWSAVERLLGHSVPQNSVWWALSVGAKGERPLFERVAYGSYRLAPQT